MVRITSTLLTAAGCFLFVASGASVPSVQQSLGTVFDSKTLRPLQWRGQLEPGKPEVILKGDTFEDIEEQAKALNPKYTIFAPPNNTEEADRTSVEAARAHVASLGPLESRQTQAIHCGWPPGYPAAPNLWNVKEGINYLRRLNGYCRQDPGPSACSRGSCSWRCAIYYCNDNTNEIWETCASIGDMAETIAFEPGHCHNFHQGIDNVKGQAFDPRNWNTIVAWGDC